ncbi:hypothetical protein [Streptomyces sp. NPDC002328]|uniref:hypothetical protein n=1 Tax=Streptomyces sp. NPDC002328 TaxID=3364642 RepID=UPI003689CE83
MSYRPYPNVDRALAQLERHRVPESAQLIVLHPDPRALAAALARVSQAIVLRPRATVKSGEHVHIASLEETRCAGGSEACSLASKPPGQCTGCGHAQHPPGAECEAGVQHGPTRWHRCLCLATPGASRACPPQMDCQGGTLGYADIWHLRHGRTLRGVNGETITPDVLAEAYGQPRRTIRQEPER